MSKRSCWVLAIAVSCILGTNGTAPAFAKAGHSGGSIRARTTILLHSNAAARTLISRLAALDGRRLGPRAQSTTVLPGAGWPYWPLIDTAPLNTTQIGSEAPSDPYVIVMSYAPGRAPNGTAPVAPADYGYAGCHPIPNGFHCDSPRAQPTP